MPNVTTGARGLIAEYLSTLPVTFPSADGADLGSSDEDGAADAGTENVSVKRKRMYVAEKLTLAEHASVLDGKTAFRAN